MILREAVWWSAFLSLACNKVCWVIDTRLYAYNKRIDFTKFPHSSAVPIDMCMATGQPWMTTTLDVIEQDGWRRI